MNKTIVVIPTYNENNNILKLYNSLVGLKIKFDILFVDDNSTDGTKEKILLLNKKSNVNFIFRKKIIKFLRNIFPKDRWFINFFLTRKIFKYYLDKIFS